MSWLTSTDQAAVRLVLAYARLIDAAMKRSEEGEVTKALYLGPHLLNTLRIWAVRPPSGRR